MSFGQISAAWDVFRRDAGPGDVGREHQPALGSTGVTCTEDPRRDSVLLWLADHGVPAIAEAAGLIARMVQAKRRFDSEEQDLLQAARDALVAGPARGGSISRLLPEDDAIHDDILAQLRTVAAGVDRLRRGAAFLEATGADVRHALPRGGFSHYVPAEPGAAWALNLALLAQGSPFSTAPPPPGLISRAVFREDVEPEDLAADLSAGAASALANAYGVFESIDAELSRGRGVLEYLSRNARAGDAWAMVAALRLTSRRQLARALSLSRGGADIQARTLAEAGLVTLNPGGGIAWQKVSSGRRRPTRLEDSPISAAAAELDATMADIDRLLARTSR